MPSLAAWLMASFLAVMTIFAPGNAAAQDEVTDVALSLKLDEYGYYINMPQTGEYNTLDLSKFPDVKSFYIIGEDNNNSDYNSTLTIKNFPEDATIVCSGMISTSSTTDAVLKINGTTSYGANNDNVRIDDYKSKSTDMTFEFSAVEANLELEVKINRPHAISLGELVAGDEVESYNATAIEGEEITIKTTPHTGYYLVDLTVTDENDNSIKVKDVDWYSGKATFIMPDASIKVTPVFADEVSVDKGARILMHHNTSTEPKRIIDIRNIQNFKSFKIRHDEGNKNEYVPSNLEIIAPEGMLIQITGTVTPSKDERESFKVDGVEYISEKSNEININYTSVVHKTKIEYNGVWVSSPKVAITALELTVELKSAPSILTLSEDNKTATFDGTTSATLKIETPTTVDNVVYDRKFTAGKPSTVMLPFNYICNGKEGGKFYQFAGVTKNDKGIWTAIMEEAGGISNSSVTTLNANTPYIFVPSDENAEGAMSFPNKPQGGFVLNTETSGGTDGNWKFVGTYRTKIWEANEVGNVYGFAAKAGYGKDEDGNAVFVAQGQFVKLEAGAYCKPMRAYLEYDAISKAGDELPSSIEVVFIDRTAAVVDDPDDINVNPDINPGDISTPVSEITPSNSAVRAWTYAKTIFIEGDPGSAYRIIGANGRILKTDVLRTTRDEISLGAHTSGVVVVVVNGKTFKLNY